jgi:DNA-binding NtrC family response regulator
MLETVLELERTMEFIPQLAEPPVRLHLLVVDADTTIRSACAEIAASLGYAVESTGDLTPGAQLLRGRAADILLVNLPRARARAWNWFPRSSSSTPRPRSSP